MNILITGASRGIGYATAELLCKNPQNQVIALSRSITHLLHLKEQYANLFPFSFDLTTFDKKVIETIQSQFQSIDILINNAGYLVNKSFEDLTDEDWQHSFDVNILGVVRIVRTLLPQMGKRYNTHILNIGSMGGFQGTIKFSGLSAYSASKAALANLTETLAIELADKHIKINCLALGSVQTEMFEEAFPNSAASLRTSQVAEYIAWFALNGHTFHNGKVIPVAVSTP
jgi:short-subunit dehydrogenase